MLHIPREPKYTVHREGQRVQVLVDGQLKLDMPYQDALQMASALHELGKKAEQKANIQQVIDDQALLIRAGVPIKLTHVGFAEAKREAEHGKYNRYLSGASMSGLPSQEAFGVPSLSFRKEKK